jgi:hypothetical protein
MEQQYTDGPSNSSKTLWIIGGIVLVIMIIGVVYAATQKSLKNANQAATTAETVPLNSGSQTTTSTNAVSANGTVLGASDRVSVVPTLKALDLANLQTFPYQVQARITGTVPDGCSTLDTPAITQTGNIFTISVTASHPKDMMCTQVITSQSAVVDVPVSGVSAGKYYVVLGKIKKSFTLVQSNQIQYSGDK